MRATTSLTTLGLLCGLALAGCGSPGSETGGRSHGARDLDAIRASGELRVLTRNAPTAYFVNRADRPAGPEYDLAQAFAESLGIKARFIVLDSTANVLDALSEGRGDLAAAGLTATPERKQRFLFGPAYREISEQVVCRRDGPRASSAEELPGVALRVPRESSYIRTLEQARQKHPAIHFLTVDEGSERLLASVWHRKLDCTVADSNIVAINRRYYPELRVEFDLSERNRLVWMLPGDSDDLQDAVDDWFDSSTARRTLAQVEQRYYAFRQVFDFVDLRTYRERIEHRYPKYRSAFRKAGRRYGIDPLLLAAQAYQESHWNPSARSHTGVRGIMMLTRNTAHLLRVSNRLNARQSIDGGARYLAMLKDRFDDGIPEPDRSWLALAAYNIGRAHVHDAQTLARRAGKNPHRWIDVKAQLPRLADKRVYRGLKYGYARGSEPVRYVERIRNYQDILEKNLND